MREIKLEVFDGKTIRYFPEIKDWDIEDYELFSKLTSKGGKIRQYTGLKDKNGKEIYEGDIIDGYVVEWCNECCGFSLFLKEFSDDKSDYCMWCGGEYTGENKQEIVGELEYQGNIYENPNLLINN